MHGTLSYFEVPAPDPVAAQRFWGELLGWKFSDGNAPGYRMIDGGRTQAGLAGGDASPHPRVFFDVDDIEKAVARVGELGGKADEPVTIPVGTFVRCADDQGVHFTLWCAA